MAHKGDPLKLCVHSTTELKEGFLLGYLATPTVRAIVAAAGLKYEPASGRLPLLDDLLARAKRDADKPQRLTREKLEIGVMNISTRHVRGRKDSCGPTGRV